MKNTIKNLSILLILFFGFSSQAQTNHKKALELNRLAAEENLNNNYEKAVQYIEQAIKLSDNEHDNLLSGNVRYTAALIYSNKKENLNALKYFQSSVNFFEKIENFEMAAKIYSQIQLIYFEIEAFEKAAESGKKAIYYSQKNNESFEILSILIEKTGDSYYYAINNDSAAFYYNELIQTSITNKNEHGEIVGLQKTGNVYKRKKEFKNAIDSNEKLKAIYEKNNNTIGITVCENNIAYNYMQLKEFPKAASGFKSAIDMAVKSGFEQDFIANLYLNLGICQQNFAKNQEAVINVNKALDIWEKLENDNETAKTLNILALVYLNSGDLFNASTHSEESINYALKSGNKSTLSDCYRTYSKILQEGNDYEKALEIFKKHLSINDSLNFDQKLNDQNLAQKIFDLERSEKELKLKLADEEVKNLAFNQLKLEAEKKEKEIELLKKEKELEASEKDRLMQAMKLTEQQNKNLLKEQEIKNLEAQKSIQDMKIKQNEMLEKDRQKELALLQSETDKQKLKLEKNEQTKQKIRWIFLLGFIIFVIIIFALVLSIRLNRILALQKQQIQEKNEELNLQNEEIKAQKEYLESANEEINTQKQELFVKSELLEYKNNEITSSINYAQKIQFAILPLMNELKEDFPEFFILYKPKDIVSGDFYWTKKIGDYHVIAIADCTGHGVPGAFMSMLGVSFLNEIVSKTRFDSAAEVLNKLRNKVKQALRQKGGTKEQKDGMDISLIVLNKQDMTLQFAGANNSLLYISDNNLEILKADRMPIGIHHKEADFTNHNIKIKSGDTIYAFSDGYQDQFGGKSGRKFLSKNLRELLFSIKEKEISSQKGILENTLSTWMSHKNEEGEPFHQVDDIMIFGVKI